MKRTLKCHRNKKDYKTKKNVTNNVDSLQETDKFLDTQCTKTKLWRNRKSEQTYH